MTTHGREDPRNRGRRLTLQDFDPGQLLTPKDVAALFQVNSKTVNRWARQGKIKAVRLPSGHRRYEHAEIERFAGSEWERS